MQTIYSVIDKELERLHELLKLTFSVEQTIIERDQILNLISDLYTMLEMTIPNFEDELCEDSDVWSPQHAVSADGAI